MPENTPLPPLEWLRVFEAAARSGNFTEAAKELHLTQAAVSQRIRNLEAVLDTQLFERGARGVELTTIGEAYAPHVRSALGALGRSTADLFSSPRTSVSIAAPASVIQLWITPRIAMLRQACPRAQTSFSTIHRESDPDTIEADLIVRFGTGNWPALRARRLFDEVLAPVAAPGLLGEGPKDWRSLPLISLTGPRAGWQDWAAATGTPPPPVPQLRFDTFALALAAARLGSGVLLGSLGLLSDDLASGTLQRLDAPSWQMEACYWLTRSASAPASEDLDQIADLLSAR